MEHSTARGRALARRWVLATALVLAACVTVAVASSTTWAEGVMFAVAFLLPLLLPLPGLLRGDRRTHAWATLCVTPYFIYGVTETIANPATRVTAGAVLFASLAFFVALVAYLRVTRPGAAAQGTPDA